MTDCKDIAAGFDIGTTTSCAAIWINDRVEIIPDTQTGSRIIPSYVSFSDEEKLVGDAAKNQSTMNPKNTVYDTKRLIGRKFSDDVVQEDVKLWSFNVTGDPNNKPLINVKYKNENKSFHPEEISAMVLQRLKETAEAYLGHPVKKAVVTVPAYFNDSQRQATRDAGKLAGLDVLRIINEPTAASLAYGLGLDPSEEKIIAVYDLGGGTFDISILRISGGVFEVLSTNGDTYLGGDDLDRAIIEYWMGLMKIDSLDDTKSLKQQLRLAAEEAKIALSNASHFETNFAGEKLSITKEIFESLITPIVNKTMECCAKAMKDAGLKVADINTVLMVGGSTRVPLVKNTVSKYFNQVVNDSVNPDEVVALGAAVQADILAGNNQSMLLLDITPLSLGIETMGGLMDVLLPRNSKIPTQAGRQYTTQKDGQSGIQIAIYQGERDLVKDNRKLGEFTLSGIPSMPAGLPKVDVQFLINADGILQVRAKELRTGLTQSIDIKPQYGLTDAEVEQRLMDSITYAKEDIATRALVEAKTEAEQILSVTEKFMSKNVSLLSKDELMQTAEAMQALQLAITMEDKNLIQGKTEALNELTRPFAERVMDQAISGALKGKGIMD